MPPGKNLPTLAQVVGKAPGVKGAGGPKTLPTLKTHTAPPPESITHAINRMRDQGYSDKAIIGQVRKWHPAWDNNELAAHIVHNTQRDSMGDMVRAGKTVGLKSGQGESVTSVAKSVGQVGKTLGQAIVQPAYEDIRHGPNSKQAQAARANQMAVGTAVGKSLTHPFTDLPSAVASGDPGRIGSDLGNIGLNFAPVGKAAGILGGLKAAKALKEAGETAKAVEGAKPLKGAAKLAAKHGIDINDVKGTGVNGKVLVDDVRAHHFQSLTPEEQLREGLKGSRSRYGVEKAAQKEDVANRARQAADALAKISDPHEALAASRTVQRGKYATIDFNGLKELNPETVKQLMTVAQHHPVLGVHQRQNVMAALDRAVTEGRNPRPAELRLIEMIFGKKTAAGLAEQAKQNLGDKIINILNIPRSLQTTGDVSGLLRQNLVAAASHPIIWGRVVPTAFKAMRKEGFEVSQQVVKDHPLYPMAVQAGVQFTDIGEHSSLLTHEEGFASDYAANALDHIPKVPNVIKGSARSYVATGNQMKMETFANRIRIGMKSGDPSIHTEKGLKQIAQVINAATGRGTLPGRAEHLLPAMNTFMFSPRLMLARLHYLDPTWYFRLKGSARREALRGLFALSASVTSALYLFSRIPGVDVGSLDPRSSDFGKLKINNTRVDIAGGFQQYVRLAAELATNTSVSSTTGKKTKLGSGFGIPTRQDVLTNFGINKLAPAPGLGVNILRGHDAVGNKLTWKMLAGNYLTPLGLQDAKSVYHEKHGGIDGITWAAGAYGLSAVGVGIQTYGPKKTAKATPGKPKVSTVSGLPKLSDVLSGGGGSKPLPTLSEVLGKR